MEQAVSLTSNPALTCLLIRHDQVLEGSNRNHAYTSILTYDTERESLEFNLPPQTLLFSKKFKQIPTCLSSLTFTKALTMNSKTLKVCSRLQNTEDKSS